MPTVDNPTLLTLGSWVYRLRLSKSQPGRVLLLLHGWTGDENSMWIFARGLPREYTLIAPRAPVADEKGGYSWRAMKNGSWGFPAFNDFLPAANSLVEFLKEWRSSMSLKEEPFSLMGFSQGAALASVLALSHPDKVRRLALLSGFLPSGSETILKKHPLEGKQIFIAHGRKDELIPVERARQAVDQLKASGARVNYCEADIGHKVSRDCIQGLEFFFASIL